MYCSTERRDFVVVVAGQDRTITRTDLTLITSFFPLATTVYPGRKHRELHIFPRARRRTFAVICGVRRVQMILLLIGIKDRSFLFLYSCTNMG